MPGEKPGVLFLAAEAVPFFKTGGLGDVIGSLPRALGRAGWEARVFLPFFSRHWPSGPFPGECWSGREYFAGREFPLRVLTLTLRGIVFYFLDQPELYGRRFIYGPPGRDYPDNPLRFGFFCRAALSVLEKLDFRPRIVHCHDWHTAPAPVYLRTLLANDPRWSSVRSVMTIHNLGYQGVFPPGTMSMLDFPEPLYRPEGVEFYGQVNILKGGIVFADRLTTVSSTYSEEIKTPGFGCGLDGLLRKHADRLSGILNGIDHRDWNPATDRYIAARYSAGDMKGKRVNKNDLCRRLNLDPDRPLAGMVTRLVPAKGVALVRDSLADLRARKCSLVLLGSGEEETELFFERQAVAGRGGFAYCRGYSEKMAHCIYAGADFFLMPSLYEPCGISQMIAMRYGTVPIARKTGGLADSIISFDGKEGTGFLFEDPDRKAMIRCLDDALSVYRSGNAWRELVENAMRADFSWSRSAAGYRRLYRELLSGRVQQRLI